MKPFNVRTGKYHLASIIAEKHGLSRNRSVEIVSDIVDEMYKSLAMGIPVTFQNFGSIRPYENYGEVMWKPGGQLGRAHEDDPFMDATFCASPQLLDAMNNEDARQTSRRYSKGNRKPRTTRRTPPPRNVKKKGRKANG